MQNYSINGDSNIVRNVNPNPNFLYLYKDTTLKSNPDTINQKYFSPFNNQTKNKEDTIKISYSHTIFPNHLLEPKSKLSMGIHDNSMFDLLLLIHLSGFILFTLVIVYSRKRLIQIFNSLFTNRATNQLIRDGDILKEFIIIPLLAIYFIAISLLFLFFLKYYFNFHQSFIFETFLFIKLLIIIIVLFILKMFFVRFISNTFKNQNTSYYYILNSYCYNIIIGFILLPLLFIYTFTDKIYSDNILIICIIMTILLKAVKIIRNMIGGFTFSKFSGLYLILYLCTVEILPVIILFKLFNRFISF